MKFVVGCDLEEFKEYYKRNGYAGEQGTGELGVTEEKIVTQDPSHLIVWRGNNKIIGHAIWHETNTEEHRKGDPRDKEDREILECFLGGKKDFVELHEVWLMKEYRGRGYGKKFFDFFEEFIGKSGFHSIVYYAFHPAAIAICRQRGYKEDYLTGEAEYVFYLPLRNRYGKIAKIVEKGYNNIAEEYQADRHLFDNKKELIEFTSLLPKDAKVLDVGCGAGVPVTQFLVKAGFDVTGVDFSETMLKLARRNVPEARFVKKDMTELDFENNSFDGLTAVYAIIHIPRNRHSSLFQGFHRILKPNGIMLVSLGPDEWEGTDEYYGAHMFWSHHNPEKSLQMIKDAGFQIISDKHIVSGGETHYWILARKARI